MLIDGFHAEETRVVIADENNLHEFDIESSSKTQTKGNLYLAKVTRVEPSLQAAFVEYGSDRQGFLPFSEIHPDYYQIPAEDKEQLLEQQKAEEQAEMAEAEAENDSEEAEDGEEKDGEEGVEDLGADEAYEEPPRRPKVKRYKVQEVIKKNQVILIQVIKEERGNKGASVTSYISIPGRCCVLMPNSTRGGGVSRKINDQKERKRLKGIVEGLEVNEGMNLILRTAGMGRTKADITRDYTYLIRLWNQVREATLSASAPALVYQEAHVVKRSIRDLYSADIEEVVISGDKAFDTAKEFMKLIMPSHVKKITKYEDSKPIFNHYDIERHLTSMYDPVVMMPSGGYLVINSTEALISVDVNSGRSTGERNVEDMATATNIEAAEEVARQLRLRDLAGLIVIDFIDMVRVSHRRQVERALKDSLKSDRAKIQVGRISPFGLLEMSRQRLRPSLTEINMMECPTCKSSGIIRSPDSAVINLIRTLENELTQENANYEKVFVTVSESLALHFLNSKRNHISELEESYGFELIVKTGAMGPDAFKVELFTANSPKPKLVSSDDRDRVLPQSRDGGGKKNNRNKRDRKKNKRDRNQDNRGDNRGENKNDHKNDSNKDSRNDQKDDSKNNSSEEVTEANKGEETPAENTEQPKEAKKKPARKRTPRRSNKDKAASTETSEKSSAPEQAPEKEITKDVVVLDEEKPVAPKKRKPKAEKAPAPEAQAKEAPADKKQEVPEDIVPSDKKQTKGWWKKIID